MDPLGASLRLMFRLVVRSGLRGVWLRGELPEGAFVWAANHHSWWDAFAPGALLWSRGRRGVLLMDGGNLHRHGYLRRVGVLGTHELRAALRALRDGHVLLIFPEGELMPPGGVSSVHPGAGWLATRAGVPLLAVATRVVNRGHQAPELYLDARPTRPEELRETLTRALAAIDRAVACSDPREPLPGFERVLRGSRSWDERFGGSSA